MEVLPKSSVCWAILVCMARTIQTVLIEGCNDGWITVQEGTKQPIICSDIVDPLAVTWSIQTNNGSYIFNESCNSTTCDYNNGISVTTNSTNSSLLTIREDHRKLGNLWITCIYSQYHMYRCQILVESTRNYSNCEFYDDGRTITGHCYMERAFRTNATVYSCQWSAGDGWDIPSALVYTAYEESTLLYYKGICYFSYPSPAFKVTFKLDGRWISQDYVANVSNDQNTTFPSLSVKHDAVNPLTLMCSGRPEPVQYYEWSGLDCAQGNQKQNVCSASTSNLTSHQPLVRCTVTLETKNYNGSRISATFYLQLTYLATSTTAHVGETTTAGGQTSPSQNTNHVRQTTSPVGHTPLTQTTHASAALDHTPDETTTASDCTTNSGKKLGTSNGEKGSSLPWGAIGGGVGAAVIIIIIVVVVIVICKSRAVSGKPPDVNTDEDFEEHVNVVYEAGDQENNRTSATPQQTAINTTIVPSYDDHLLDDAEIDMGYTIVRLNPMANAAAGTGAAPENGGMTHTNSAPAMRHDLALADTELIDDYYPNYSAVDMQRPKSFPATFVTSAHGDEYSVVDKSGKGKKGTSSQPDVTYAEVDKPKPNPAGDAYAEVNRSSERGNSQVVQQNVDSANCGYFAEVQQPRPDNKPTWAVKPALKLKPTLQPDDGATPGDEAEPEEYNVLNLGVRAQITSSHDTEQYSHIRLA